MLLNHQLRTSSQINIFSVCRNLRHWFYITTIKVHRWKDWFESSKYVDLVKMA